MSVATIDLKSLVEKVEQVVASKYGGMRIRNIVLDKDDAVYGRVLRKSWERAGKDNKLFLRLYLQLENHVYRVSIPSHLAREKHFFIKEGEYVVIATKRYTTKDGRDSIIYYPVPASDLDEKYIEVARNNTFEKLLRRSGRREETLEDKITSYIERYGRFGLEALRREEFRSYTVSDVIEAITRIVESQPEKYEAVRDELGEIVAIQLRK